MSKLLAVSLTVILLGTTVTAGAADSGSQMSPQQRYEAACSKAGFLPGEVNFQDCISTLKQTARSMARTTKGSMARKACTLAGFPAGSDALNSCIDKLNLGIIDDSRDNG